MSYNKDFFNAVGETCLRKFKNLPKTGKPKTDEWTVFSAIVQDNSGVLEVVALGTGSKCIGRNSVSPNGDVLNDSHSEIICRRAFLIYLYSQIKRAYTRKNSIFMSAGDKYSLKFGVTFHFFSTHVPCGDAAIFHKQIEEDFGECLTVSDGKRKADDDISDSKVLKVETIGDVHRTGGKCLPESKIQDPRLEGSGYHTLGAVRTKPGRGDPTLSVSCSDKLAKYTFVGIQGALLSILLDKPIYLTSFILAGNTLYDENALQRAFCKRFDYCELSSPYQQHHLIIGQADALFEHHKTTSKRPCPSSIIFSKTEKEMLQVAVEGRKQGITKKALGTKKARVFISKVELFGYFLNAAKENNLELVKGVEVLNYLDAKMKAVEYQEAWKSVKCNCFKVWTKKDENMLRFRYNT